MRYPVGIITPRAQAHPKRLDELDPYQPMQAHGPGRALDQPSDAAAAAVVLDQVEDPFDSAGGNRAAQDQLAADLPLGRQLKLQRQPSADGVDQQQVGIVQPLVAVAVAAAKTDTVGLDRAVEGAVVGAQGSFRNHVPRSAEGPSVSGEPQPGEPDIVLVAGQAEARGRKLAVDGQQTPSLDLVVAGAEHRPSLEVSLAGQGGQSLLELARPAAEQPLHLRFENQPVLGGERKELAVGVVQADATVAEMIRHVCMSVAGRNSAPPIGGY